MSGLTLTNTVYIRTTAEQLWQALTDGDVTAKYLSGTRVQSNWRPGDEVVYLAPDRSTRLIQGTLLEVEPRRRLAFECRLLFNPALAGDSPHRETFEIEEMGRSLQAHRDLRSVCARQPGVSRGGAWHAENWVCAEIAARDRRGARLPDVAHVCSVHAIGRRRVRVRHSAGTAQGGQG